MRRELEQQEEGHLEIQSTFSSLKQELEAKTKKLQKLMLKLRKVCTFQIVRIR